ncbi:MAG: CHASE2 domain-containing protein [Desulforhopalus sp.]
MAILATVLVVLDLEPLSQLDRITYDYMLRNLGEKHGNPKVIIVDVDEASLARYGQWPWSRDVVAQLLDVIQNGKPDFVGIDILFAEPDRTSLQVLKEELQTGFGIQLDLENLPREMIDHDWSLARTLTSGPFSLGIMFRFGPGAVMDVQLPYPSIRTIQVTRKGGGIIPVPVADGLVRVLPQLIGAANGLGFVNVHLDQDGVIRRAPLLIQYNDTFYPSLGMLAGMRSMKSEAVIVESGPGGILSLQMGNTTIPVDRQGNIVVRYRGPARTYTTISAEAVLGGKVPPEMFKGKVVFLGASAEGLMDNYPTPFDRRFPGVELHASVAGGILAQDFIAMPDWAEGAKGMGIFIAILLALAGIIRFSTLAIGGVFFGFLLVIPLGSAIAFESYRLFISPASSMVVFVTAFALLALVRFRSEEILEIQRERELTVARDCAMWGLASLAETRDSDTGFHILRTQRYLQALAQYLARQKKKAFRFEPKEIDLLVKSAPLHDIGKVGVPDSILLKPGKLTQSEFEEMKKHTVYGAEALAKAEFVSGIDDDTSFLRMAREIALTHHEKWDGTGYPNGLKAEEIPSSGRLMALADVYDALTSERVYKKAMSHENAATIIREGSGTHFDPEVVAAFMALEGEFKAIAHGYIDKKK